MQGHDTTLDRLVELSCWLGAEQRDCTILGEGNTSAALGQDAFLVKASGTPLGTSTAESFVEVRRSAVDALLDDPSIDARDEPRLLREALTSPDSSAAPSVETPLHAVCLGLPGVRFVGHSHPTAVNAIACANGFEDVLNRNVFPDQVVACGPRSLRVPCATPGLQLGRALRVALEEYLERWGEAPKTALLRNHGFVALGATAGEVKALTQMAIKAARILSGTLAFGGPHEMPTSLSDPHTPGH